MHIHIYMEIKILFLTGKQIRLTDIDGSCSLDDLKKKIQEVEGIPPYQQSLAFEGKVLELGRWSSGCGTDREVDPLAIGSTLNIRLRGEGNQIFHTPVVTDDDHHLRSDEFEQQNSNNFKPHVLLYILRKIRD
ncbi:hypothetical protein Sjap_006948 [Stephania japonica]|uniref:Ubiquitin-like domain-containing protein n=1 Tax=Stephania japonica TaxID=461633 RepID=A0AAP0K9F7_9MAGN